MKYLGFQKSSNTLRILFFVFFTFTVASCTFLFLNSKTNVQTKKNVLSVKQTTVRAPPQAPSLSPSPTVIISNAPSAQPIKKTISLALFGDSMIDTMGEKLEILEPVLKQNYPSYRFLLYNYGIGAQNVSQGLDRFHSAFSNRTRNYPSIVDLHPDIIVLGTFSYNPFNPHDPQKHRNVLGVLLEEAKKVTPKVYLLIEISPLSSEFGKGKNGVDWPDDERVKHAALIREQLQNALQVAVEHGVWAIDTFSPSTRSDGSGNPLYVNPDDGIHPSYAGQMSVAKRIAAALRL